MTRSYSPVIVEKDADGYFARCPQLQGCYTQGETYDEAMANIRDAIPLHIEDRLACGEPLPAYSGNTFAPMEQPGRKPGLRP